MDSDLSRWRPLAQRRPSVWPLRRLLFGLMLGAGLSACATPLPPDAGRAALPPVSVEPAPMLAQASQPAEVAAPAPASEPAPFVAAIDEASNVFFAPRSAQIDAAGQQVLRAIAERLAGNRRASVLLIGHSDGQGSRSYNLAITEERLVAAGKALRGYGVAARQIRRNRVGCVRSAPDCQDEACWRMARRVELVVTP